MQNPFLDAPIPAVNASGAVGARGIGGSARAQAIADIANDSGLRVARVQYLQTIGRQMQDELKNVPHQGSSRLTWLSQQLNRDF